MHLKGILIFEQKRSKKGWNRSPTRALKKDCRKESNRKKSNGKKVTGKKVTGKKVTGKKVTVGK